MTRAAWVTVAAIVLLWKMRQSLLHLLIALAIVGHVLREKKPCRL